MLQPMGSAGGTPHPVAGSSDGLQQQPQQLNFTQHGQPHAQDGMGVQQLQQGHFNMAMMSGMQQQQQGLQWIDHQHLAATSCHHNFQQQCSYLLPPWQQQHPHQHLQSQLLFQPVSPGLQMSQGGSSCSDVLPCPPAAETASSTSTTLLPPTTQGPVGAAALEPCLLPNTHTLLEEQPSTGINGHKMSAAATLANAAAAAGDSGGASSMSPNPTKAQQLYMGFHPVKSTQLSNCHSGPSSRRSTGSGQQMQQLEAVQWLVKQESIPGMPLYGSSNPLSKQESLAAFLAKRESLSGLLLSQQGSLATLATMSSNDFGAALDALVADGGAMQDIDLDALLS
jgi:hypothetical protein